MEIEKIPCVRHNPGDRIVIKKFTSQQELYDWLKTINVLELQAETTKQYGSNSGHVELETLEFVITIT